MIARPQLNQYLSENEKFYNVLNYALIKKDFEAVRFILTNPTMFTRDPVVQSRIARLFLLDNRCVKWFGLAESINQSTVNMVFSGNVDIKINGDDDATYLVENFLYDGQLIETLKEAYASALAGVRDGKSYILMRTTSEYDLFTGYRIKDNFLEFEVLKQHEVSYEKNKLVKTITKDVFDSVDQKNKTYYFDYVYTSQPNGITRLEVIGKNEDGKKLKSSFVKKVLGIKDVVMAYSYQPFFELNIGRGQLPNIIYIEDSLAQAMYFKDKDLANSQTKKHVPENLMYKEINANNAAEFDDPYSTTYPMKKSVDGNNLIIQEGKSAVKEIEEHMKLDILQGCLDAKINPISLGYSLLDSMANNTDTTTTKERVSIRLRETHIAILKILIAKIIKTFLLINGKTVEVNDIAVLFDQYITPSTETITNVLAKQVQFGIKSIEQAVSELNKNEMSDEEIKREVGRIKDRATQLDFNMTQRKQAENEKDSDKEVEKEFNKKEPINNKEDNNLKSDGVVE